MVKKGKKKGEKSNQATVCCSIICRTINRKNITNKRAHVMIFFICILGQKGSNIIPLLFMKPNRKAAAYTGDGSFTSVQGRAREED